MLHIQQITRIGAFHTNHCEDYVIAADIGNSRKVIAVFDGCTMGEESHFAATLLGRLIRKIAKAEFYRAYLASETGERKLEDLLEWVVQQLFTLLIEAKNSLQLERNELLSTVVLGILDAAPREAEFICLGDGLIQIDGTSYEFEQGNQPDYLAYHLHEPFDVWYAAQQQKLSCAGFSHLALSTDGILTFVDRHTHRATTASQAVVDHLLGTTTDQETLQKRLRRTEQEWGLIHTDDLGIITVIVGN